MKSSKTEILRFNSVFRNQIFFIFSLIFFPLLSILDEKLKKYFCISQKVISEISSKNICSTFINSKLLKLKFIYRILLVFSLLLVKDIEQHPGQYHDKPSQDLMENLFWFIIYQ
ncbi:hypothetical protein M0811_12678 [Anaeramoeba ignava]|uniref:Uncharacterized protein n=1 Tax=Anaeramoeba ignava TaxID=1746090 RepID=A0A9Q0R674_ANAIG|nr:hypothetical protein M0811_12678 [Anaeramoeba ignava]